MSEEKEKEKNYGFGVFFTFFLYINIYIFIYICIINIKGSREMRNPCVPSTCRQIELQKRKATFALRPRKGDFKHHRGA